MKDLKFEDKNIPPLPFGFGVVWCESCRKLYTMIQIVVVFFRIRT
jgi:hypothetical protein